jgi:ElaB/YqjD/DUF883 family membrane-anchored ribosome-binding protein
MDSLIASRASTLTLAKGFVGEMKTFVRQEFELFKTELSEKISSMGRNAVSLAIGGFVAYAGLLVFLFGLGWLLTFAFTAAGLSPLMASFLGMAVIGLVVMLIGAAFIAKALSAFKKESLAPERSLQTLQELKGGHATAKPEPEAEHEEAKRSSAEIQAQVEETEQEMGETLDELGRRLSPAHINRRIKHRIQERPYRAGLIAMIAGVLSGMMVRRKFQRA